MKNLLVLLMVVTGALCSEAQAGISLGQTRLVYQQGTAAQSLSIRNTGDDFYLVEAAVTDWVSNRPTSDFSVLPPLFRLESNSDNVLRVVRTGGNLPQDRESVFHLRVNAIPGSQNKQTAAKGGASLAISLGMGIKLFYRPDGLSMTPEEAAKTLTFSRQGQEVLVNNPTPYYLTLARLSLGGVSVNLDNSPAMLAPFSRQRYPSASGERAEWEVINDYGGSSDTFHATVK
jgi:P pilus assembly chaperone PapD